MSSAASPSLPGPAAAPDPPTLWQSVRGLPGPIWVLCVGTFVNKFGAFVMPFLTLYLQKLGYPLSAAGAALACYGVGNFIAAGYGGILADRIGRRKTIVLSMGAGAACMVALSQVASLPWIIVLAFLCGLSSELYRPAASALIIDLVPPGERVTAFATYRLAFNAGWALGPATAGFLARHSYTWLFVGDALTCAVYGLVAWFFLPRGVLKNPAGYGWGQALRAIRRHREFLIVLVSYLAIGTVLFQFVSTFGVFVKDLGFDERTYGMILGLNGLIVVLFELPVTQVTRRRNPVRVIAAGYAFMAVGISMYALPLSLAWLFLAMAVLTVGEILALPVAITYVSALAPEEMRGRYMGATGLVWSFCSIVVPALGLQVLKASPTALWIGCGLLGALASVWILRLPAEPGAAASSAPAGFDGRSDA